MADEENYVELNDEEKSILLYLLTESNADTNIACQNIKKSYFKLQEVVCNIFMEYFNQNYSLLMGGSFTEGCSLTPFCSYSYLSAYNDQLIGKDSMLVPKGILVLPYSGKDRYGNFHDVDMFFEMVASSTRELAKPGYTKLKFVHVNEDSVLFKTAEQASHISHLSSCLIRDENGDFYLSSERVKKVWKSALPESTEEKSAKELLRKAMLGKTQEDNPTKDGYSMEAQPPAVVNQNMGMTFSPENLVSIRCEEFPGYGYDWMDRASSRKWPGPDLCRKIINQGCQFVPIGNPLSTECEFEWRISFTLAERELIASFNETQHKCLLILKQLMLFYLQPYFPDTLNSYHIKTLIFWEIEFNENLSWEPDNIKKCMKFLFARLLSWIGLEICENYFLPRNNLFERKIGRANKVDIIKIVRDLQQNLVQRYCELPCNIAIIPNWREGLSFEVLERTDEFKSAAVNATVSSLKYSILSYIYYQMRYIFSYPSATSISLLKQQELFIQRTQSFIDRLNTSHDSQYSTIENDVVAKIKKFIMIWCGSVSLALHNNNIKNTGITESKSLDLAEKLISKYYQETQIDGHIRFALYYITVGKIDKAIGILEKGERYTVEKVHNIYAHNIQDLSNLAASIHDPSCAICKKNKGHSNYNPLHHKENIEDNPASIISGWLNGEDICHVAFHWLEIHCLPQLLQYELMEYYNDYRIDKDKDTLKYYCKTWEPMHIVYMCKFTCYQLENDIEKSKAVIQAMREKSAYYNAAWCALSISDVKSGIRDIISSLKRDEDSDHCFPLKFVMHVFSAVLKANE